jgi:cellobiose-specific phosphotransferase system component IIA
MMSKHTYGFSAERDRKECEELAVSMAKADGFLQEGQDYQTELLETDAHKENNEFCIVVRTP